MVSFCFKKSVFCSIYIIITVTLIRSVGSRQVDRHGSPDQTRHGFSDQVTYYIPFPHYGKKYPDQLFNVHLQKNIRALKKNTLSLFFFYFKPWTRSSFENA